MHVCNTNQMYTKKMPMENEDNAGKDKETKGVLDEEK